MMNAIASTVLLLAAAVSEEPAALRGLDPVELCEGNEVPGREELALTEHVFRYLFASEETLAEFRRDPARYEIQLGGGCGRMGPLSGSCSADRFTVWDGRIYIFASDSCRQGFLADPPAHLDRDDPVPPSTPETAARGAELVLRALAGLGGAERVDAARTFVALHEETSPYQGRDVVSGTRWTIAFPDRIRSESFWDTMRTTRVVAPGGSFTANASGIQPLHAVQRSALEKDARRSVLAILKARTRPDFRAVAQGASQVEGVPVEELAVSFGGATSVLGIDPETGRVLRQTYTGRPQVGPNGVLVFVFSDFRESGGLTLPFAQATTFDGKAAKDLSFTWTALSVNEPLDPGAFERPE